MSARVARPLTLIVAVPEEIHSQYTTQNVLDLLLAALNRDDVSCIQFVPKWFVRVTFKTFEARQAVLRSGIAIESSFLTVFEADPVNIEVSVEHLPFEVPDDDLRTALSPFGVIHNVRLQTYVNSDIFTGSRILTMSLACDIPVNLRVLRYPCRILYRGQPRPCPICRSDGHRASACLLRDKCRLCLQPGHLARDCKPVPSGSNDSFEPDDSTDDELSDDQSDEFASGDEEVLEAASAPTPPPDTPPESAPVPESAPALPSVPDPPSSVPDPPSTPVPPKRSKFTGESNFRWLARYPEDFRQSVLQAGHTTDSHVVQETYQSGSKLYTLHCVFDFGIDTFKILKDVRTFEDARLSLYSKRRFVPSRSVFPGVQATDGPVLPANIAPEKFPAKSD